VGLDLQEATQQNSESSEGDPNKNPFVTIDRAMLDIILKNRTASART